MTRGVIMARRGDAGAWGELDQAAATAEGTEEAERIVPVRLARAEAHWLAGEQRLARREAELAADRSAANGSWDRGAVTVWLRRTGSTRSMEGELAEPYRLQIEGEWQLAAQAWTELGCPYEAALALLDSADETALRQALSTLTDLGASACIRLVRARMRSLGFRSIPNGARPATRTPARADPS